MYVVDIPGCHCINIHILLFQFLFCLWHIQQEESMKNVLCLEIARALHELSKTGYAMHASTSTLRRCFCWL